MSLDAWSFNGTDLSLGGKVSVTDLTGLGALAAWRGVDVPYAGLPGARRMKKLPNSRLYSLALQLIDTPTANLSAGSIIDQLAQLFGPVDKEAALAHTLADTSVRTAQAQAAQWNPKPDGMTGTRWLGSVDFDLADPYFYGPSSTVTQAIAASPTSFTVTSAGTQRTHKLVLTFTGPIVSPRITNTTNGWYVEVDVTVASAQLLVIDCGAFTAFNNGVSAIASVVHSGGSPFMRLEPGVNTMQVTSTSPGGSVSVQYSPPYL